MTVLPRAPRKTGDAVTALPLPGRVVLRAGPVSAAVPLRAIVVGVLALALALSLAVISVGRGEFPIPPGAVWDVLNGEGTRAQQHILLQLRMPRVVCALLVGAALAMSGALTQTFARNPLASPDVLGVTGGAAVGAVAAIVLGGITGGILGVPFAALLGATVSAALIYVLAYKRGIDGYRLVLVGLGVGEVLSAIVSYLLVRADLVDAKQATIWLTGSVSGRDWSNVRPLAAALLVLAPLAVAAAVALRVLQFGDDTARALGLRLQTAQLAVVAIAVALAAAAVSAGGPVEFVAFVVPQIALRLCGGSRPPVIVSGLLGALLVVGADLAARIVVAPRELPAGLLTAMIGAPYLLWLLLRGTRRTIA
ncbi:iron chelate uptake ABC transporter family permease subunit [Dactylosporangium sp. NPDC005555]|uniref:FecCD family ABC transporter permease n=1 Tax=Dactylosporangium sp. NPDC005555 TaxID=3154889 RepID=UPI0033BCF909